MMISKVEVAVCDGCLMKIEEVLITIFMTIFLYCLDLSLQFIGSCASSSNLRFEQNFLTSGKSWEVRKREIGLLVQMILEYVYYFNFKLIFKENFAQKVLSIRN